MAIERVNGRCVWWDCAASSNESLTVKNKIINNNKALKHPTNCVGSFSSSLGCTRERVEKKLCA